MVELPTIDPRPLPEADLTALADSTWLVLTSPSGAEIFFDLLRERGMDARRLAHLKIAALGPGTAKALAGFGLFADLIPPAYDAASLGRALASKLRPGGPGVPGPGQGGEPRSAGDLVPGPRGWRSGRRPSMRRR